MNRDDIPEHLSDELRFIALLIIDLKETLMTDFQNLQTEVAAEDADLDTLLGLFAAMQASNATMATQLADLKTQVAALPGDTSIVDASLAAITAEHAKVTAARATVATPAASTTTDTGTVAGGAPAAGATSDTSGATGTGTPSDTTATGAATATGGATPEAATLYEFVGAGTPDTTVWPVASVETTDTPPKPLYHYTGDSAAAPTAGAGVDPTAWQVYTGATQPTQPSA
jgi:hypothetical protein